MSCEHCRTPTNREIALEARIAGLEARIIQLEGHRDQLGECMARAEAELEKAHVMSSQDAGQVVCASVVEEAIAILKGETP